METNPTRVCELIVGLPAVRVLGVDEVAGEPLAFMSRLAARGRCVRLVAEAFGSKTPMW